jgi:fructosamine-3-kinase
MDQSVKEVLQLIQPALHFKAIKEVTSVGGGCTSKAYKVSTEVGIFFIKTLKNPPKGIFEAEAKGLKYLSDAVSTLLIPEVLAWGEVAGSRYGYLAMEYLPPSRRKQPNLQEQLGRGLALLHKQKEKAYGFPATTYCGLTPQQNTWKENWIEFYRNNRIQYLLTLCYQKYPPFTRHQTAFSKLIETLDGLLLAEGPCLVHGDLWSGNYHESEQGIALIDPACSYSEREFEFGIITLFGGFSQTFWEAYQEVYPFQTGWEERFPLYQLYHYLNHFYLFGGSYWEVALQIALRFTK